MSIEQDIQDTQAIVSHRNHPLRGVQQRLEGYVPEMIGFLYRNNLLENTQIERVLNNAEVLHPDDVTLTGLELTIDAAKALVNSSHTLYSLQRLILGGAMDAADGALARHLKLASPEGAVKDVLADRIGDVGLVKIITKSRSDYAESPLNLEHNLIVSFHLSTLTKAASEMCGAKTSEGGSGSMLERRRILLSTLQNLGTLHYLTRAGSLYLGLEQTISMLTGDNTPKNRLLHAIDQSNALLIDNSFIRAKKRTNGIALALSLKKSWLNNPDLDNPKSAAAVEARKYASVVLMLERKPFGIDIMSHLNTLVDGVSFPSAELLVNSHSYIADCVNETNDFLTKALTVADLN